MRLVGEGVLQVLGLTLVLVAVTALSAPSEATEPADCPTKLVFKLYCLGEEGQSEKVGKITATTHDGRYARVDKRYVNSWDSFSIRLRKIEAIYEEEGENLDYWPASATSSTRKGHAAILGGGHAERVWRQDGWTLRLLWSKEHAVTVRYEHDELAAALDAEEF